MLAYLALLHKWNRVYNLTAVRDPGEMVYRHLLDSLAVLPWIDDGALLDVGSGAGLPAVPLAIARPGLAVTALDSNHKKTRFITQARLELGLDNLDVVHARIAELARPGGWPQVISRAFASVADFVTGAGPSCAPGGRLLAMKGRPEPGELAALPTGWRLSARHPMQIPGLTGDRELLVITRS